VPAAQPEKGCGVAVGDGTFIRRHPSPNSTSITVIIFFSTFIIFISSSKNDNSSHYHVTFIIIACNTNPRASRSGAIDSVVRPPSGESFESQLNVVFVPCVTRSAGFVVC
jgi:hypothetical protein